MDKDTTLGEMKTLGELLYHSSKELHKAIQQDIDEGKTTKPRYCPNCGKKIDDCVPTLSQGYIYWDCYCPKCKFSGFISNDSGWIGDE